MNSRRNVIILYGSYGYTGRLIAQECKAKGLEVILAGRNQQALQLQSSETGYPYQVVEIADIMGLQQLLRQGSLIIHCGGPFQFTAHAVVNACLETKTHYTDITGEHQVFEMLAGYDAQARDAGIMIMPGTGFDVVPSDCLALHLKSRLPSATHLQLAFSMSKGGMSRGTSRTMTEGLGEGSMIRKDGRLTSVALGKKILEIDFGSFKSKALNIPWGDISTAWRSTGISNIEVYMAANDKLIRSAKLSPYVNWLLRQRWVKNLMQRKIDRRPDGPTDERRSSGKSFLWGKVWDTSGKTCVSTMETVSGYTLTVQTSTMIAQKILNGNFNTGYQTPAMAYGADLILELKETRRIDLETVQLNKSLHD
jgi:short subunit dehydrogenase-like uncharacterized protein